MRKKIVIYKRKKYIKVATATGNKLIRILVIMLLLSICTAVTAKEVRVFTGDIQRVEKTVGSDGNTYFLILKNGTVYQLADAKQYDIALQNWRYFRFIVLNVKDDEKE